MAFLRSYFACAFCWVLTASLGCGQASEDSRPVARNPPGPAGSGTAGSDGVSTRAPIERSWLATESPSELERVFVVAPLPPLPRPPQPPLDRRVCELGQPSTPATADTADSGQDSGTDAALADAGVQTSFELPELGRPCGNGCPTTSCYEAPSGKEVCHRLCVQSSEP